MADGAHRRLLREARDDPSKRVAALRALVRAGLLELDRVRLAAYLGDEIASAVAGDRALSVPEDLDRWFDGIRRFGTWPWLWAIGVALGARLGSADDPAARLFHEHLWPWLERPVAKRHRALSAACDGLEDVQGPAGLRDLLLQARHLGLDEPKPGAGVYTNATGAAFFRLKPFASGWVREGVERVVGPSPCPRLGRAGGPGPTPGEAAQMGAYGREARVAGARLEQELRSLISEAAGWWVSK